MKFDLIDLSLFVAAVDTGSLTKGSERIGLALAAASARIRLMEARLRVKLLERSKRGVVPTSAGVAMLNHARIVLNDAALLEADVSEFARGLKGKVRLMSNTNALAEFLPQALGAFLAANPDISVSVEERLSLHIVQAVSSGEAAIGIVASTINMGSLEHFPFARDRLVLVVPHGWRPDVLELAFKEALGEPFIGLQETSAIQTFVAEQAARSGHILQVRMQLLGFEQVCKMVESRAGIAVVPESSALRAAQTMSIRIVPLLDEWSHRDLRICVKDKNRLAPVALQLFEHLVSIRFRSPRSS
ncbi:LysR family transcriptional regulator [Chelatococcus sp. GCM10030263]|uniref:LysR family transcriptional regulator n=1 Tax=Chelatococcus sp. GCM10030263 TaxID=3273387 RepID=UPI0036113F44